MEAYQVNFVVLTPLPYKYVVLAESEADAKAEAERKLQAHVFELNPDLIRDCRVAKVGGPHS